MAKFEVMLANGELKLVEAQRAYSEAGVHAFQDNNTTSPKMFFAAGVWTICRCVMPDSFGNLR